MLKQLKYIPIILSLILILGACGEREKQLFDDKDAFFSFQNVTESIVEDAKEPLEVPLYLSKSIAHGNVAYSIDIEGIENPAIEGVDFTIGDESKMVVFDGNYIEYIQVISMDNDVQDGAKQFHLVLNAAGSSDAVGMAQSKGISVLVTINDNEHPLSEFFGTFDVNETTIEPAEYGYEVELSGHADADKAILTGLWDVQQEVVLQFDYDNGTVKILADQTFYGVNVGIILDFTIYGWHWIENEDGSPGIQREPEVTGTFDLETGVIEFPTGYLLQCSGPEGSEYIGGVWLWSIQDYSKLTKK
jgi:hypothetical protein